MKPATQKIAEKVSKYFVDKPVVNDCFFWTYARGKERIGSDVDVLVETEKVNDISIFDWVQMREELHKKLRKRVDMSDINALQKYIEGYIHHDKTLIYEDR